MKKLFLSILSVAVIAGSVFAFAGCKDYTSDIDDLKSQIQELDDKSAKIAELEAELAKLKTENNSLSSSNSSLQTKINSLQTEINNLKNKTDLYTGSPKFNYGINETIPYYVNGTKIFDFKVTKLEYDAAPSNALYFDYQVTYAPTYKDINSTVFSAKLYRKDLERLAKASAINDSSMSFFLDSNSESNQTQSVVLLYCDIPFACVTAKPTLYVKPTA